MRKEYDGPVIPTHESQIREAIDSRDISLSIEPSLTHRPTGSKFGSSRQEESGLAQHDC